MDFFKEPEKTTQTPVERLASHIMLDILMTVMIGPRGESEEQFKKDMDGAQLRAVGFINQFLEQREQAGITETKAVEDKLFGNINRV